MTFGYQSLINSALLCILSLCLSILTVPLDDSKALMFKCPWNTKMPISIVTQGFKAHSGGGWRAFMPLSM